MANLYGANTQYDAASEKNKPTSIKINNLPSTGISGSSVLGKFKNLSSKASSNVSGLAKLEEGMPKTTKLIPTTNLPEQFPAAPRSTGQYTNLLDYAKQYPEDINFKGYQPSEKSVIYTMPGTAGEIMAEPGDFETLIKTTRSEYDPNFNRQIKGSTSAYTEVDHVIPLWLGGANTPQNMEVLAKTEHDKKTRIQSVIYTLYTNGTIDREKALAMTSSWKDYDDYGVPEPLGRQKETYETGAKKTSALQNFYDTAATGKIGTLPEDIANFYYKKWTETPSFIDQVLQGSNEKNKIGGTRFSFTGLIKKGLDVVSDTVGGKASYILDEFTKSLPDPAQQAIRSATKNFIKESTWGYVAPTKSKTEEEESVANFLGGTVGSVAGFLVGFGEFKLAKEALVGLLAARKFKSFGEGVSTADKLAQSGLIGKMITPQTFKAGSVGARSVGAQTASEISAIKGAQAVNRMSPGVKIVTQFGRTGAPIKGLDKAGNITSKIIKNGRFKDIAAETALLVAYGQANRQEGGDQVQARLQRAMNDVIFGSLVGASSHTVGGYGTVFGGSFVSSYMLGADAKDAFLDAATFTALHSMGHKNELNMKKIEKERIPKLIDEEASKLSYNYLKTVAPNSTSFKDVDYKKIRKEAAINLTSDQSLTKDQVAREMTKVNVAVRQLEKKGMTLEERNRANTEDFKTLTERMKNGDSSEYMLESGGMSKIRKNISRMEKTEISEFISKYKIDEADPAIFTTAGVGMETNYKTNDLFNGFKDAKRNEIIPGTFVLIKNNNKNLSVIQSERYKNMESSGVDTSTRGDPNKNVEMVYITVVKNSITGKLEKRIYPVAFVGSEYRLTDPNNKNSLINSLSRKTGGKGVDELTSDSTKDRVYDLMEKEGIEIMPVRIREDFLRPGEIYDTTKEGRDAIFAYITNSSITKGKELTNELSPRGVAPERDFVEESFKEQKRGETADKLISSLEKYKDASKDSNPIKSIDTASTDSPSMEKIRNETSKTLNNVVKTIKTSKDSIQAKESIDKELGIDSNPKTIEDLTFNKREISVENVSDIWKEGIERKTSNLAEKIKTSENKDITEENIKEIKEIMTSTERYNDFTDLISDKSIREQMISSVGPQPEKAPIVETIKTADREVIVSEKESAIRKEMLEDMRQKVASGEIKPSGLPEDIQANVSKTELSKKKYLKERKEEIEKTLSDPSLSEKKFNKLYKELESIENNLTAYNKSAWKGFAPSETKEGKYYYGPMEKMYDTVIGLEKSKLKKLENLVVEEQNKDRLGSILSEIKTTNEKIKELKKHKSLFEQEKFYKAVDKKYFKNEGGIYAIDKSKKQWENLTTEISVKNNSDKDIKFEIYHPNFNFEQAFEKFYDGISKTISDDLNFNIVSGGGRAEVKQYIKKLFQDLIEKKPTYELNYVNGKWVTEESKMSNMEPRRENVGNTKLIADKIHAENTEYKLDQMDFRPVRLNKESISINNYSPEKIQEIMNKNGIIPAYIPGNSKKLITGIYASPEARRLNGKIFDNNPVGFMTEKELNEIKYTGEKITDKDLMEGLKNPYTGDKLLKTKDDLDKYKFIKTYYIDQMGFSKEVAPSSIAKRAKIFASNERRILSNSSLSNKTIPHIVLSAPEINKIPELWDSYKDLPNSKTYGKKTTFDGAIFAPDSMIKEISSDMGMPLNTKTLKPMLSSKINADGKKDVFIMKGQISGMTEPLKEYLKTEYGLTNKEIDSSIITFTDNVKNGLEGILSPKNTPNGKEIYKLDIPLLAYRFKYYDAKKESEKTFFSLNSKLSSTEAGQKALESMQQGKIDSLSNFINEIYGAKSNQEIYLTFLKYEPDLKLKIGSVFTKDMKDIVKAGGGIKRIAPKLNDFINAKKQDLFSAAPGVNRIYNTLIPDYPVIVEKGKRRYLKNDEIMMSSKDVEKIFDKETVDKIKNGEDFEVMAIRSPLTTLKAVGFKKIRLAEQNGIDNMKGLSRIDHFDVYGLKEGDYDGDAISIFPINGVNKDYVAEVKRQSGAQKETILPGLDKYAPVPLSPLTIEKINTDVAKGGENIGFIAAKYRAIASFGDLKFNVKIKDGVVSLNAGNKVIKDNITTTGKNFDGVYPFDTAQKTLDGVRELLQEALDSANTSNFSKRGYGSQYMYENFLFDPQIKIALNESKLKKLYSAANEAEKILQIPFKIEKTGSAKLKEYVEGEEAINKNLKFGEASERYGKYVEGISKDNEGINYPLAGKQLTKIAKVPDFSEPIVKRGVMSGEERRNEKIKNIIRESYSIKENKKIDDFISSTIGVDLANFKKATKDITVRGIPNIPSEDITQEFLIKRLNKERSSIIKKLDDQIDDFVSKAKKLSKEERDYIAYKFVAREKIKFKHSIAGFLSVEPTYSSKKNIDKIIKLSPEMYKVYNTLYEKLPESVMIHEGTPEWKEKIGPALTKSARDIIESIKKEPQKTIGGKIEEYISPRETIKKEDGQGGFNLDFMKVPTTQFKTLASTLEGGADKAVGIINSSLRGFGENIRNQFKTNSTVPATLSQSTLPNALYEKIKPQSYNVDNIVKAISQVESSGGTRTFGKSGETGSLQFMPATWNQYSAEYAKAMGINKPIKQTESNQIKVAKWKISNWLSSGVKPANIAAAWNAGEGYLNSDRWKYNVGVNSRGIAYNTPNYVTKFMKYLSMYE